MKKLVAALIVIMMLMPLSVIARAPKPRIRVAYPLQNGLTYISEDGAYSGYTYDYLKELERFSAFEFEFVTLDGDENEQITKAMDMVADGTLDLMGATIYLEPLTNLYDYATTNYGAGHMAIYVRSDNERINDTNIYSLKELEVGVVSNSGEENQKLKEFGEMTGIDIKQRFFDTGFEMKAALDNNEIESITFPEQATLTGDYRIAATYDLRPFYFIATKGKSDIISDINESMIKLNREQPFIMSELHEKYFSLRNAKFTLTDEEKAFLAEHPVIDVAVLGGNAPMQSTKMPGNNNGITIDVLDYIGELCGIRFRYRISETYDEYMQTLEDEDVLVVGGVTPSFSSNVHGFTLSRAYLESQIQIVMRTNSDVNSLENKVLGIPREYFYEGRPERNIVYYDTAVQCIEAVSKGEIDFTCLSDYTAQFYSSSSKFPNITIIPQNSNDKLRSCIAIKDSVAMPLANIINKGVDHVARHDISSIVFKNATYSKEDPTLANYIKNNPLQFISFIIILASVLILIRFQAKKTNDAKIITEYNRFKQISDLSGDCFIEYNIKSDCLKLTGGAADLLSRDRVIDNYSKRKPVEFKTLKGVLEEAGKYETEMPVPFLDGTQKWQRLLLQPVYDDDNEITHIIGKITDIQAQKEEQLLWKDLAHKDSLTEVYNSAACRAMIETFLEDSADNSLAFLVLDIDKFKSINDTNGHLYGDQVLQKIAHAISDTCRSTDIVGRVGGDEFVIGLKKPESQRVVEDFCHRLMKKIDDSFNHSLTISIGIAFSKKDQKYDDIYQCADSALYQAKSHGRNNFQFSNGFGTENK